MKISTEKISSSIIICVALILLNSCATYNMKDDRHNSGNLAQAILGTYVSKDTICGGGQLILELKDDHRYIEYNYWGAVFGEWHLERAKGRDKYNYLVLEIDSIVSDYFFHEGNREKYKCWIGPRYFYSTNSSGKDNVICYKDITGEALYCQYYNAVTDTVTQQTEFFDCRIMRDIGLLEWTIPQNSYSVCANIFNSLGSTCCECVNYCQDSGNVTCVLFPSRNVYRYYFINKNTIQLLYPYDQPYHDILRLPRFILKRDKKKE